MLARIKGVEGHPGPIHYYLGEYWYVFSFPSVVALGGLITCLKHKEPNGWSIVISFLLVVTVLYSLVGTKLTGYVVPAFPFLCLLSAMAITEFSRRSKYAPICILVAISVYGLLQWNRFRFRLSVASSAGSP